MFWNLETIYAEWTLLPSLLTNLFPTKGVSGSIFSIPCFIEIPVLHANSVNPDQTPRFPASDLGLHC